MADKVDLDSLLKDKLAQLEMANPTLSEEEAKKQKEELNAELKDIKAVYHSETIPIADKIAQLKKIAIETVKMYNILIDGERFRSGGKAKKSE